METSLDHTINDLCDKWSYRGWKRERKMV